MTQSIALYARVSSDKQAQEGTIQSQIESLRSYAKANGYPIEEDLIFMDEGISGTTLVRPALDALRDKAACGEIDKVLILCPDRLARKYAHQLILVEEFQRLAVEIVFANRNITASAEDQLLLQIQGVMAEYEREKIIERSRRGKLHKAKQGKVNVLSGAPYGYVYMTATESEEARYEIHSEEAEVVRRIFQEFTQRNNKKFEYLLSGLVRCKPCGYALYGKPASNSRYKRCYYRCMGQDGYRWPKGRVCSSHPIRVEVLDDLVWEQTKRLIKEPPLVFKEYVDRVNKKGTQQLSLEAVREKKKKELRQQELEKQRLLDLYQGGNISLEEIEPRLKTIRSKIKKIEQESTLLEQEKKRELEQLQLIEQFEDFRKHLDTNLSNLKFEDKKTLVRLLVSEVIVDVQTEEIVVRHTVPVNQNVPLRKRSHDPSLGGSRRRVYHLPIRI